MRLLNKLIDTHCVRTMMLVALLVGGFALSASAATSLTHLIVNFKNGSKTSFVLADKPVVKFDDKKINIKADIIMADYAMAEVRNFVFGDVSEATIAEVASDNEIRYVFVNPDEFVAAGLSAGDCMTVASVNGVVVMTGVADNDGSVTLDLSSLPHGVYVVTAPNKQAIKIKH